MAGAKAVGMLCLLATVAISCCCLASACEEDKNEVMHHCWKNIEKHLGDQFPKTDSQCCQHIMRIAEVNCICARFTHADLAKISLSKVANVCKVCGNPMPANTNCAGQP
ncbi:hypothetical protein BRADI_4g39725v3 [Brachypodium distachyon]|uniref:Bifunctional inhibitor/plant lipid transfer protein/seed storage helical domain-containing protein n=1 Tax=Brachypodium distachyon TaxID=15368 RepID=A0A0Q3LGJ8_BRADI|nr:hypothetical protein BRADI_4g39725v3 [Brachypodium distachyon]